MALILADLGAPVAAAAPALASGADPAVPLGRVVLALLLCLALGAGAIMALRRRLGAGALFSGAAVGRRLRLIEQLPLGPQRGLVLVEIDGQPFAALYSGQGASLVPLTAPVPPVEDRDVG